MKASLKINKMLAACVVALAAPTAFAQTISVSDTNGVTNSTAIATVTIDRTAQTVNGFLFELDYDVTRLNLGVPHTDVNAPHPRVTVVAGSTGAADFGCVENVVGTLRCAAGSSVTSATFGVNVSFTTLAVEGLAPLTLDPANTNFVNAGFADTAFVSIDNGSITLTGLPPDPPTINFAPTTVNLANGGALAGQLSQASPIAVTATGGTAPSFGSYTCAVPAGFQVTNSANPTIIAGTDPADMSVTCTLGGAAVQSIMTCQRTGAAVTPVDITLNCPAGAGPVLSSTPANGTPLTCNGTPLSVATTNVTISNTGTADITGATCNTVGAGFSVTQQPSGTIAPGASSLVTVSCNVPAEGAPAIVGTLNCTTTSPAGGALAFPLSSLGQSGGVAGNLETIPASSLWAKIGLIGLLAALGLLVVGFRRHN
jgi:hypothetical protein